MARSASPATPTHGRIESGGRVLPVTPCPHCGRRFFVPIAIWRAEDARARCGDCDGVFDVRLSARLDAARARARANATPRSGPLTAMAPFAVDGIDPDEFDSSLEGFDLLGDGAATAVPATLARERSVATETMPFDASRSGIDRIAEQLGSMWGALPNVLGGALSLPGVATVVGLLAISIVAVPTFHRDSPSVYNERLPRLLASIGCVAAFCEVVPPSFPERFELLRRQVYSHPTRDDTLVFELSFANAADIAQRLPRVELRFADSRGERVGGEDLLPRDYASNWSPGDTIAPGARQDLVVELPDPGATASRFDLAFRTADR